MGIKIKIDKDTLYQLYINENKTSAEIAKILGCSVPTIVRNIKINSIKKSRELIVKKTIATNIEKYGVENPLQNQIIKTKIIKTNLERYGCENPSQSKIILDKIKKTNLEKYGFSTPLKNDDIKKKIKNTLVEKYGVENPSHLTAVKEKIKKTSIENGVYGLIFNRTIAEWTKIYNLPQVHLYKWLNVNKNVSYDNFINYLENYQKHLTDIENIIAYTFGIEKWDKFLYSGFGYKPDFKLSEKIYLNVDGLRFHSREKQKNDYYHFELRKTFEEIELRVFQFRADEVFHKMKVVKSIVDNVLGMSQFKIGARKTNIRKINSQDAKQFLDQNHIKGYKSAKHLGLYFNNELVSLMSYKTAKNKKKESFIKIERFCSKVNTNVMGGFSKLLKQVQLELPNLPTHYWVDLRYGTGNFLLNHGFKLEKETLGWEWTDFEKTYNRLRCRANMDDRKLSEKEYAEELKWYKIYDAGQRLFVRD